MLDRWYSRYEDSAKMLSSKMASTGRVYEPRSVRHITDSPEPTCCLSPMCVDLGLPAWSHRRSTMCTVVRDGPPLSHLNMPRVEQNGITDERLGSHG